MAAMAVDAKIGSLGKLEYGSGALNPKVLLGKLGGLGKTEI